MVFQGWLYRKQFGAKPNLNKETASFDKFIYQVKEIGAGKEITLGNKKVTVFQKNEYKIVKGEGSEYGLKEIWGEYKINCVNSKI